MESIWSGEMKVEPTHRLSKSKYNRMFRLPVEKQRSLHWCQRDGMFEATVAVSMLYDPPESWVLNATEKRRMKFSEGITYRGV